MRLRILKSSSKNKAAKSTPTKSGDKLTEKQYEELGRIVASVYETGYLNSAQSYKNAFIKGMFQGFGGIIGATILVGLLIWLLSLFNEVPLIGDFVNQVENTVEQGQR